jgi:hypothetical protein
MFTGLFNNPIKKIMFEDIQTAIKTPNKYILINTLPSSEQNCLIVNTIPDISEERFINDLINKYRLKEHIFIVYGRNTGDENAEKKYKQLLNLGFTEVYLYPGGLFEWLLLQDIYGRDEFPTSSRMLDILKYKPHKLFENYFHVPK